VGLVDGEQRDAGLVEQGEAARRGQALGREVQQVELAREQFALDDAGGGGVEGGVEERGADAELPERRHLVLHQCDQRRNDDRGPGRSSAGSW